MPETAVLDACVLYSAPMRDLLVRLAVKQLFHAKWTARILDECFHSILLRRPDLSTDSLARTRELLSLVLPSAMVTGHERHITEVHLPDAQDRHVVAAAIEAQARMIVTINVRDFPAAELARYSLQAIHPDDFICILAQRSPHVLRECIIEQAGALSNPPMDVNELLHRFRVVGLARSADRCAMLFA